MSRAQAYPPRQTGRTPAANRPAKKWSGGLRQKLGLCCSLIRPPWSDRGSKTQLFGGRRQDKPQNVGDKGQGWASSRFLYAVWPFLFTIVMSWGESGRASANGEYFPETPRRDDCGVGFQEILSFPSPPGRPTPPVRSTRPIIAQRFGGPRVSRFLSS